MKSNPIIAGCTMQNCHKDETKERQVHWEKIFARNPAFFGEEPSDCGRLASARFQKEGVQSLVELGCGQGRDTILFAQNGFDVTAVDYSSTAVSSILEKAKARGLASRIHAQSHDVKRQLPFPDNTFDACFAHMLLCMELATFEIVDILRETHRILKPHGLLTYSVRSNFDKHFRTGTHLSEDMYEIGDFVIHFFTEEKIHQLAKGYEIVEIQRQEEGSLPRDLFIVTLRKVSRPGDWSLTDEKEDRIMNDPMEKFEDFFNAALAPGILDHKTKQLVALGAALAAGCDSWTDSGLAGARAAQASEQEIEEVAAIAMAVTAQAIRKQFRKNNPATRSDSDQQTIIASALSLQPGRS